MELNKKLKHPLLLLLCPQVLGLNCGNFESGREFDALLIDPNTSNSPLDIFPSDKAEDIVKKFLYTGKLRRIVEAITLSAETV